MEKYNALPIDNFKKNNKIFIVLDTNSRSTLMITRN